MFDLCHHVHNMNIRLYNLLFLEFIYFTTFSIFIIVLVKKIYVYIFAFEMGTWYFDFGMWMVVSSTNHKNVLAYALTNQVVFDIRENLTLDIAPF